MSENRFKTFDDIVNNFEEFCDAFEGRAAEAFMRGDQNDGRVNQAAAESGASTPKAVREVAEPGPADHPIGAPYVDVSQTFGE